MIKKKTATTNKTKQNARPLADGLAYVVLLWSTVLLVNCILQHDIDALLISCNKEFATFSAL